MQNELTRPIVGIENRTAQEVFDIMCDRIRSALSAQVQDVAGWQPIETAPKDGSSVLLRLSNGEVFSGWGALETDGSKTWRRFHATSADVGWLNARHWMPLPAAPAKQEGGE